jgi:hypothetical protein
VISAAEEERHCQVEKRVVERLVKVREESEHDIVYCEYAGCVTQRHKEVFSRVEELGAWQQPVKPHTSELSKPHGHAPRLVPSRDRASGNAPQLGWPTGSGIAVVENAYATGLLGEQ